MKRVMILHSRNIWGTRAELYFDNVEVISNRTDRIVVEAIFSVEEGVYFNHMDFNDLQRAMLGRKYFMELEKEDRFEPSDMVKVEVDSVKFIESRRKSLAGGSHIDIRMRLALLYK
jgi:hypothetical protein